MGYFCGPFGVGMAFVKYRFLGLKQVGRALDSLTEPKFRQQALRAAGKAAMTPTLAALKTAAPRLKNTSILPNKNASGDVLAAGDLADGLKLTVSTPKQPKLNKRGTKVTDATKNELRARIMTGRKSKHYAVVSEYGRDETTVTKYSVFGRPVLGGFQATLPAIQPKPWIRTTFDQQKGDMITTFSQSLGKAIQKKAKQQYKRQKKRG